MSRVIDFHTHTFPDRIAPAAVRSLREKSHTAAFSDATETGLRKSMAAAGGKAPIHQGTTFAHLVVEKFIPIADGVVVSISPIDTLVVAEQIDKHIHIVIKTTG